MGNRGKNYQSDIASRKGLLLHSYFLSRKWIFLSIVVVVILGFVFWLYDGPGEYWVNFYLTCTAYEIFWCLGVFFFRPVKKNAGIIAIAVFTATCMLEVLQLWKAEFLENVREMFLGMAIIGTDFVWLQFPFYVVGSLIGFVLMRQLGQSDGE